MEKLLNAINYSSWKEIDIILIMIFIIFFIQFIIMFVILFPHIKKIKRLLLSKKTLTSNHPKKQMYIISQISEAVLEIQKIKKGALIVIEKEDRTESSIFDGDLLDSHVTKDLLINIFEGSKTPLHDGAVVIRKDRILYAGGFISTLTTKTTTRNYGTRHRSAIGLTEKLDCVAILVSEESGKISVVVDGVITEINSKNIFEELSDILIGENFYKK